MPRLLLEFSFPAEGAVIVLARISAWIEIGFFYPAHPAKFSVKPPTGRAGQKRLSEIFLTGKNGRVVAGIGRSTVSG
ncbi:MAG: hypothetical protein NDJ89_18125 [Oligoflexia bacterium]|nr:hypothetical protein [Oligoflexia bacterium]